MKRVEELFLESVQFRFQAMKENADGAIGQLSDADLIWTPHAEVNSVAVTMHHCWGNMLSRWTDFLTTDGEKPTRDRDEEFAPLALGREEILARWEAGWRCLFDALDVLRPEDLAREVTIRGQKLGVIDAIHRQMAHYGYHVGQIVCIAKLRKGAAWQSLSIPPNKSRDYTPMKRD